MAMVTPNSDEFWPGAVVPLSTVTMEATSGTRTEEAPRPTSSAMVNSHQVSTVGVRPSRIRHSSAASRTATPALSSRWRDTIKPVSRNSGCGSMATISPMSTPSCDVLSRSWVTASMRSSTSRQLTGWLSISVLKVCPEALSGRMVPRQAPPSEKIVQRAPSAKRDDQWPMGTTSSRPLAFTCLTWAPRVSMWATMARAGVGSLPGRRARMAPRRVIS
ncbi:hypothetical protein D3C77_257230 [compost metagenome]